MKRIDKLPSSRPSQPLRCAIFPNRTTDPEGFIDTRTTLNGWDQRVYLSVAGVREAGRLVGMVPAAEVEKLEAELEQLGAKIAEQQEFIDKLDRFREAEAELEAAVN